MARQTSKNRWVSGKRKLAYQPNYCEFAGGYEMGEAVEIGHFYMIEDGSKVTWPSSDRTASQSVYSKYEHGLVVEEFLSTGKLLIM